MSFYVGPYRRPKQINWPPLALARRKHCQHRCADGKHKRKTWCLLPVAILLVLRFDDMHRRVVHKKREQLMVGNPRHQSRCYGHCHRVVIFITIIVFIVTAYCYINYPIISCVVAVFIFIFIWPICVDVHRWKCWDIWGKKKEEKNKKNRAICTSHVSEPESVQFPFCKKANQFSVVRREKRSVANLPWYKLLLL